MGALRELSSMARDYGLGLKYFLVVGGIVSALMLALFLWGSAEEAPESSVPATAPAAPGLPPPTE